MLAARIGRTRPPISNRPQSFKFLCAIFNSQTEVTKASSAMAAAGFTHPAKPGTSCRPGKFSAAYDVAVTPVASRSTSHWSDAPSSCRYAPTSWRSLLKRTHAQRLFNAIFKIWGLLAPAYLLLPALSLTDNEKALPRQEPIGQSKSIGAPRTVAYAAGGS